METECAVLSMVDGREGSNEKKLERETESGLALLLLVLL